MAVYGIHYFALPLKEIPKNFTNEGGLMTLSRYPIIAKDFKLFTKTEISNSARGMLYTKIQVKEDKIIHVFNTHLQSAISSLD